MPTRNSSPDSQSRFVEMFGDLANPSIQWDKIILADACKTTDDIKCGPFGTQLSKDEYCSSGIPVWEIPQINSEFKMNPVHFLTPEKAKELNSYSLIPGDIAMSRKGNVGLCAVFPSELQPGIIHSDVLRIRIDSTRLNPIFLMCQFHLSKYIRHQIMIVSSGAIMAGINVSKLKNIRIHVPPILLQNQFADFVQQVDKSRLAGEKASKIIQNMVKYKVKCNIL